MGTFVAGIIALGVPIVVFGLKVLGLVYMAWLAMKLLGKLEKWFDSE